MADPSPGPVHDLRRPRARDRQILDHGHQRFDAFAQPGRLGGPVVHLGIDVDRVFSTPRRCVGLVPHALKVRRLSARPRTGDQQVAPVLVIERRQRWIVHGIRCQHPLVGRPIRGFGAADVEAHLSKQPAVLALVVGQQGVPTFCRRVRDGLARLRFRITGDVAEAPIAGGGGDQQDRGVSPRECQPAVLSRKDAANGDDFQPRLVAQGSKNAVLFAIAAGKDQSIAALDHGDRRGARRIGERRRKAQTALPRRQSNRRDLIDRRHERLASMSIAACLEGDGRDRAVQIELAAISLCSVHAFEIQEQVAQAVE